MKKLKLTTNDFLCRGGNCMKMKKVLTAVFVFVFAIQSIACFASDLSSGWTTIESVSQFEYYDSIREKQLEFAFKYDYHEGDFDKSFNGYPGITYTSGIEYRDDGTQYECPAIYVDNHAVYSGSYDLKKGEAKFIINGMHSNFFDQCVLYNSRTLVPIDVFKSVGCEVEYNNETLVATVKANGITLEILPYMIGMRKNQNDGFYVPLEVCARYIEGDLYVPVRAIAEEFGIAISWDGATQTVYLGKQ